MPKGIYMRKIKHPSSETEFKKGQMPWNKGKHPEYVQGKNHFMYGKENKWGHHKLESIKLMSEVKKRKFKSGETKLSPNAGWNKERRANFIFPKKDTTIEVKIQIFLKQMNIEFLTHQYMNINHAYQCDIFIPSKNMVIECDGIYWHNYPLGNPIDITRSIELREKGYKILRLWENEIKTIELEEFKQLLNKMNPIQSLPVENKSPQGGYYQ